MATNENYQYGIADQENVNPSPSNLTITHLTPELTTVTLAVGESIWIRIEDISREDYGQLYWSTSEKEHVQVDQGGTITAVNPGEATITVKAGRNSRIAAKVKVYVIPDSLCYSSYAARLLPTAISDDIREILRNDFNITILMLTNFARIWRKTTGQPCLMDFPWRQWSFQWWRICRIRN